MRFSSLVLGIFVGLTVAACGANPCQEVSDKTFDCYQGVDCSTVPAAQAAVCAAAKVSKTAGGTSAKIDSCTGDTKIAAEACLLKGIRAPTCSCL
ncbi:MAG: hypothetical protein U1E65_19525 [Myxococcota bacterium]